MRRVFISLVILLMIGTMDMAFAQSNISKEMGLPSLEPNQDESWFRENEIRSINREIEDRLAKSNEEKIEFWEMIPHSALIVVLIVIVKLLFSKKNHDQD